MQLHSYEQRVQVQKNISEVKENLLYSTLMSLKGKSAQSIAAWSHSYQWATPVCETIMYGLYDPNKKQKVLDQIAKGEDRTGYLEAHRIELVSSSQVLARIHDAWILQNVCHPKMFENAHYVSFGGRSNDGNVENGLKGFLRSCFKEQNVLGVKECLKIMSANPKESMINQFSGEGSLVLSALHSMGSQSSFNDTMGAVELLVAMEYLNARQQVIGKKSKKMDPLAPKILEHFELLVKNKDHRDAFLKKHLGQEHYASVQDFFNHQIYQALDGVADRGNESALQWMLDRGVLFSNETMANIWRHTGNVSFWLKAFERQWDLASNRSDESLALGVMELLMLRQNGEGGAPIFEKIQREFYRDVKDFEESQQRDRKEDAEYSQECASLFLEKKEEWIGFFLKGARFYNETPAGCILATLPSQYQKEFSRYGYIGSEERQKLLKHLLQSIQRLRSQQITPNSAALGDRVHESMQLTLGFLQKQLKSKQVSRAFSELKSTPAVLSYLVRTDGLEVLLDRLNGMIPLGAQEKESLQSALEDAFNARHAYFGDKVKEDRSWVSDFSKLCIVKPMQLDQYLNQLQEAVRKKGASPEVLRLIESALLRSPLQKEQKVMVEKKMLELAVKECSSASPTLRL